jgi:hypothetical protein
MTGRERMRAEIAETARGLERVGILRRAVAEKITGFVANREVEAAFRRGDRGHA